MPGDARFWDGMDVVIGQDADANPSYLPEHLVHSAVNKSFRGGNNDVRPTFSEMELVFENSDDEAIIRKGNFQGAMSYDALRPGTRDGILCAFAGRIFFLTLVNNRAYVLRIHSGYNPRLMHVWFVQAEDQVYIQNGTDFPLQWDGNLANQATILNPFNGEMPVGTFMIYAHGRVFLALANNLVLASDNIFGNGFTRTDNTKNFTEGTYWNNGGSFGAPLKLGKAYGMTVMPAIGVSDRGQGEVVVMYENGAMLINASMDRSLWATSQVNRVGLIGRGCRSPWSVTNVNGDIWFRSDDGWAFFSNSQADFSRAFSYRKLSREVNPYVDEDTPFLRQFASAMYFDNRVLSTINPYIVDNENPDHGKHRPHSCMGVVDLDQTSGGSPDNSVEFRWNGLWTGVRPLQFVKCNISGEERGFVWSFDDDGNNRLYELNQGGVDDWSLKNGNVPVKSMMISKRFGFEQAGTTKFRRKPLNGGDMWLSEMSESVGVKVQYRPDNYPCYFDLLREINVGCESCEQKICTLEVSRGRYKRIAFNTPDDDECLVGEGIPANRGSQFQVKVELEGRARIDRLRISASQPEDDDNPVGDCLSDDPNCNNPTCCPENLYDYGLIIDA